MTEAKDYLDFLEQHRLMDDAQKYPLAVEYARSCEREIVTLHEERDRLRAALTYYADRHGHVRRGFPSRVQQGTGNEGGRVTIDAAKLRELHYQYDPGFEDTLAYCFSCMDNVMELKDAEWPCPTSELLDAYEEREQLRADLEHLAGSLMGVTLATSKVNMENDRLRAALEELKATIQSVCEAGHVDFPGLEILGEALGESDTALEGRE